MKLINVTIEGTTSLLQHRFHEEAQASLNKSTRKVMVESEQTPRAVAEKAAYRLPGTGNLFFPGAAISRLLREAGGQHKQRGSRKSVKYLVPAAVLLFEDAIPLVHPKTGEPLDTFEVDSRPVVIPATKGRVMCHRPRLDEWGARFDLRINESILPDKVVHQLLTEGGMQIGIGDFRPERGGPFGTFRVTKWVDAGGAAEAAE